MELQQEKKPEGFGAEGCPGTYMNYTKDNTYHDNTWTYKEIYDQNWDLVEKCLMKIIQYKRSQGETDNFVLADFGTADGQMIMPTFKRIIEILRKQFGNKIDIGIIFEDQEKNNHNVLMHNMQDFIKENEPITCLASGTSMYKRCVIKNSVDFCFSVLALQWLSKRPTPITNGMVYTDATPQEMALLKQQSQDDFYNFLTLRLEELKPGGMMFICCTTEIEDKNSQSTSTAEFYATLTHTLTLMSEEEIITKEELRNIALYLVPRTKVDFEETFQKCKDKGLKFDVEHFRTSERNCFSSLIETKQDKTLKATPVQEVLGFMTTVFYSSVYEGLSNTRSSKERRDISWQFFNLFMKTIGDKTSDVFFHTADFVVQKHAK